MVTMTPEAVSARLREVAELSRALGSGVGPQAVSMSAEAVSARLREWAQLTELCLRLQAAELLAP